MNKKSLLITIVIIVVGILIGVTLFAINGREKVEPVMKSERNQKDINNLINAAVQEILLDKSDTKYVLNKVSQDWQNLTD